MRIIPFKGFQSHIKFTIIVSIFNNLLGKNLKIYSIMEELFLVKKAGTMITKVN